MKRRISRAIVVLAVGLAGCDWSPQWTLTCGPDGMKTTRSSVSPQMAELCQEAMRQPRPLQIDQNSVVCWKKGPDGWQWEQCARNELTQRQREIYEERLKERKK